MEKILAGHTTEESAFVVEDYPYGFRLRCSIRYWIETTKQGDRFCSQTSNPKKAGLVWNKPKKSTYMSVMVMGIDEKGHVTYTGISKGWSDAECVERFINEVGAEYPFSEQQVSMIKLCKAINAAQKYIKVEVVETTGETVEEREAREAKQKEVQASIRNIVAYEYSRAEV